MIRVPIQVINLTANSLEMVEKAKVNKITVRDLLAKEAVNVFGLEDYPNNKQVINKTNNYDTKTCFS